MIDLMEALALGMQSPDEKEGRIYGLLYGKIVNVTDPSNLGRVKARVGSQGDKESTDWLDPAWPGGIEGVPVVGEPCFVQFVDGDPNRGVYWWHPTTNTQNRAKDFMLLGTTFLPLYNDLVAKFNNLLANFNAHTHVATPALTAPAGGGAVTGTVAISVTINAYDSDANAAKAQAADGSTPAASASATKVLSGSAKVK